MALTQQQPNHYELHDPDVRLMLQVRGGSGPAFEELVLRMLEKRQEDRFANPDELLEELEAFGEAAASGVE